MVNINTVYQTVLQILNKEQRGYITPAEFNNLAQQVQLEIFESYFPDGNQLNRQNQNNSQNDEQRPDDIDFCYFLFQQARREDCVPDQVHGGQCRDDGLGPWHSRAYS